MILRTLEEGQNRTLDGESRGRHYLPREKRIRASGETQVGASLNSQDSLKVRKKEI